MPKQMPFLKNPPRSALKARRKRRPVSSDKKRRANAATTGVETMARKAHRRHTRRRNPVGVRRAVKHTRRRHRRNPPAGGIMGTVTTGLQDGLFGLGGSFAVRYLASMLGMVGVGYTGYLVEAGLGVVGALALRKVAPGGARAFLQGAFMAPMGQLAKSVLPVNMSAYLGDGQYNALVPGGGYNNGGIDPAVQVGMQGYPPQLQGYAGMDGGIQGYPDGSMAGYVDDSMGDFDSMAGSYR